MNDKPEAVAWMYKWPDGFAQTDLGPERYPASYVERHGLTEIPLYPEPSSQDASALVEAAKALCGAIVQDEQGGWRIAGDDPEALACNLHSALTAWEAQHG